MLSQQQMDEINRKIAKAEREIIDVMDEYHIHPGDIVMRLANTLGMHQQEQMQKADQMQMDQIRAQAELDAELKKVEEEVTAEQAAKDLPVEDKEVKDGN